MGQFLHGSATTTEAVRRAIQHSQESLRALARRYGINQKTVAKWKKRTSVTDVPTGPTVPQSTVLTAEEEAVIVAFRRHTLLALDDCLYALQPSIPHLSRSSLHRCLQRHGISRLPDVDGKSAIIPHTKNGNCGLNIHGIRFLVEYCAPAMAAAGKGQAQFWSRTGLASSEPCLPGCAIPAIVRDWTADRPL
jgi:transposase-like protein